MIQRALWVLLVALLVVNLRVILERRDLQARVRDLEEVSAVARLKTEYAREEERLLVVTGAVPANFPRLKNVQASTDAVQFVLLASADDCTNAIEDEVAKLNQLAGRSSTNITGVQAFFVNGDEPSRARSVVRHLSPPPVFPVTIRNVLRELPDATTPLVLVIRSRDGRILEAHKPIPQDLSKRDAFYVRWSGTLGLS